MAGKGGHMALHIGRVSLLTTMMAVVGCTAGERAREGVAAEPLPAGALVCIDGPSVYDGGYDEAALGAVLAMRPACARLNVRQVFTGGGLDAQVLARHDELVDRYRAAGIEVYMLISYEVAGLAPDAPRREDGFETYARAFAATVEHFRDRVRVYEVYNEPNDTSPGFPKLDEPTFARVLARVYRDVRLAAGERCWPVYLISGAPLAFNWLPNDERGEVRVTAADYIRNTYEAGIHDPDPRYNWQRIREESGSYPLDGVGYHFYFDAEPTGTSSERLRSFLDEVWDTVTAYEGADTPKRLWISEFGWQSDDTPEGDQAQENLLRAGYSVLTADPRVAMAMWFKYQDFPIPDATTPEGRRIVRWGLYRLGGFSPQHARPALGSFVEYAERQRPRYQAHLEVVSAPSSLPAGGRGRVRVRATNFGSLAWQTDEFRLGAGPGCPVTWEANTVTWSGLEGIGYGHGATDARVFLPAGATVAPGASVEFDWEITAPSEPGTARVVARMVHEGVAWFGHPAVHTLTVTR